MQDYTAETYGDTHADTYDLVNSDPVEIQDAVEFLTELAGRGPVLDAGAGTGRVAIPLASTGLPVYAVEISERMAEKLQAKPGGGLVHLVVGDMASVDFDEFFSLIYIAQGSLHSLLGADEQSACLRHLAQHLAPGGHLVVESLTLDLDRFVHDQYVDVTLMDAGHLVLSAAVRHPESQTVDVQSVLLTEGGIRLFPLRYRHYTAEELDMMAGEAGLNLRERWSDWARTAEKPDQRTHVSVYVRDVAPR